jgi:tRNA pseudouridine55 synthase
MNYDGFVNINKPIGWTSSDVVVKVRGILQKHAGKKLTVGHLGTLDPQAQGVLPIAVGKATQLFDGYLKKRKKYVAEFTFGETTDTLDSEGEIKFHEPFVIYEDILRRVLNQFRGKIMQVPPAYSAKLVGGKRAYDLAREGKNFELDAKEVEIFSLNAENLRGNKADFYIECSAGTYIRSLARDIAKVLGTVGYMSKLKRTQVGEFLIDKAVSVAEFEQNPIEYLDPLAISVYDTYPKGIVLCLGFFDVGHIGHKAVFDKARQYSEEPFVFSFTSHEIAYFNFEERKRRLQKLGMGRVIYAPWNSEFLAQSGEEFAKLLNKNFKIEMVIAGENFTFGCRSSCSADELSKYFKKAEIVRLEQAEGQNISSTRVRALIKEGRFEEANLFMPEELKWK